MRPEPTILAFDTSAAHCAAALLVDGRIVAHRYEEMGRGQAERLFPLLEELLAAEAVAWKDLNAIGVGVGPGNFTGIRIAVAATRGLSLGLGVPAIGVTTFEAAYRPLGTWFLGKRAKKRTEDRNLTKLVYLPAPRGAAYVQAFKNDVPYGEPVLEPPERLDFGPHMAEIDWADATLHRLAEISAERFAQGGPFDRPAPLYIRPADAAPPREAPPVILP